MRRAEQALRSLLKHDMSIDPKEIDSMLDGYCALEGPKQYERHEQAWKEAREVVAELDRLRVEHVDEPFKDLLTHEHVRRQTRDVGEYVVVLSRDGENFVEAKGYVQVIYGRTRNPQTIFTYSGSLEKAQGYAQGFYDALQVAAGVAGRSAEG